MPIQGPDRKRRGAERRPLLKWPEILRGRDPLDQFPNRPLVIGNSQRHRGGLLKGRVATAEIVEGEPQGQGVAVVIPLFARRICQSRHPTHAHPQRQIAAFDNRRAGAIYFRRTAAVFVAYSGYVCRRVSVVRLVTGFAVMLDYLHEVDAVAERYRHRRGVGPVSIRGQLKIGRWSRGSVSPRISTCLQSSDGPSATQSPPWCFVRWQCTCNVPAAAAVILPDAGGLFAADVPPRFVAFNLIDVQANHRHVQEPLAALTNVGQEGEDRVTVDFHKPFGAADRRSFKQLMQNLRLFNRNPHRSSGRGRSSMNVRLHWRQRNR